MPTPLWMDSHSAELSTIAQSYPHVVHTPNHMTDSLGYLEIQPLIHRLHRTYCYSCL